MTQPSQHQHCNMRTSTILFTCPQLYKEALDIPLPADVPRENDIGSTASHLLHPGEVVFSVGKIYSERDLRLMFSQRMCQLVRASCFWLTVMINYICLVMSMFNYVEK
ncbi:hypothetical protein DPMN_014671 [Dreissena polymorpha]|uniref:Uncharacterized protein n=1 Tax=Dreissena polymorpha TaxID=45954 RepID=A0A9D4N9M8_DREPO|nr:hypothetical protein DPMN_014671 [Dreissena polymorpha]